MKKQDGKTSLGWIITIVIVLLIAGVSIAMIFGDADEVRNSIKQMQNSNTNNTVQTQKK